MADSQEIADDNTLRATEESEHPRMLPLWTESKYEMRRLFYSALGHSMCLIFVLEAVQAGPLISNTGNAFQQILQNTFHGTQFTKQLI